MDWDYKGPAFQGPPWRASVLTTHFYDYYDAYFTTITIITIGTIVITIIIAITATITIATSWFRKNKIGLQTPSRRLTEVLLVCSAHLCLGCLLSSQCEMSKELYASNPVVAGCHFLLLYSKDIPAMSSPYHTW